MIEQDKRRVGWFHWLVLFVGITSIVYSQSHDTVAVEVPVVDSAVIQRLQVERDQARKERDDYQRLSVQLKAMVRASNITVAQLTDQLEALSVSVPSQPIILQAVRKEASTPAGFRQVVARNFGKDIAAHIQIIKE
jgi:hypothetical protein